MQSESISELLKDPITVIASSAYFEISSKQGDPVYKTVFVVWVIGDALKDVLMKICEGWGVDAENIICVTFRFPVALYAVPENPIERRKIADGVDERIGELNVVLKRTEEHRLEVCVRVLALAH
jgi:hypothetical protein